MRLIQFRIERGRGALGIAVVDESGNRARVLADAPSTYALALDAVASSRPLAELVESRATTASVDLDVLAAEGRLTVPLTHPDPAHLLVCGTGLTHLGSADARDALNKARSAMSETETDSARMFRWGLEGGKPASGPGVQPEWFFKGTGHSLVDPGEALVAPSFALDGGEEPELALIYLCGPDGRPHRVGTTLGNEFSDHALERENYLYLAHSKLRPCSFGPELLLGEPPADVHGVSRIRRGGQVVWERTFLTGEDHMSHALANLEHHHFKYAAFRQPGDVHVLFLGTATLSVADGFQTEPGDEFEMAAEGFGRSLRNTLARGAPVAFEHIRAL